MKALVVGLGGIGQRHVRNLRTILGDSLELIAYRVRGLTHMVTPTLQLDTAKNIEQEYGITVFDDLAKALAQRPDIALICNPSGKHVPAALACVEAGCDLFLEKPVSNSLDGVDELLSAVESRKRIVMVGYQLRFHPCLQALRQLLDSGKLGRVLAVRATVGEYLPNWHKYEDYRQMYASRADLGGGVILSQIHELDYLYSLFGLPRRVFALGGHWSSLEIDVEDVASVLLECQVGGKPVAVHLHQDYVQRPPSRQCEVICDQGKAIADFAALRVTAYDSTGESLESQDFSGFDRNILFMEQTRHFLECVEQRRQPVVNLRDGVQSLRMALAAKESIATGAPVNLHD
jgi:predicted dehydrogenase